MGVLGAGTVNVNNNFTSNVTAATANRSVVAPEPPCQCTVDHFLAPLKFKMKGLKKIRKKIGLGTCVCLCVTVYIYMYLHIRAFERLG